MKKENPNYNTTLWEVMQVNRNLWYLKCYKTLGVLHETKTSESGVLTLTAPAERKFWQIWKSTTLGGKMFNFSTGVSRCNVNCPMLIFHCSFESIGYFFYEFSDFVTFLEWVRCLAEVMLMQSISNNFFAYTSNDSNNLGTNYFSLLSSGHKCTK